MPGGGCGRGGECPPAGADLVPVATTLAPIAPCRPDLSLADLAPGDLPGEFPQCGRRRPARADQWLLDEVRACRRRVVVGDHRRQRPVDIAAEGVLDPGPVVVMARVPAIEDEVDPPEVEPERAG